MYELVFDLLIVTARQVTALAKPGATIPEEELRCDGDDWLALRGAIDKFCGDDKGDDDDCRDRHSVTMCSELRPAALWRLPQGELRLQPDCWYWTLTLRTPSGRVPKRTPKQPLARLFKRGWRVSHLRLEDSRCD